VLLGQPFIWFCLFWLNKINELGAVNKYTRKRKSK